MLREVRLYGDLGRTFGRSFKLDVSCVAEAVAALRAMVPGFEQYLVKHSKPGFAVFVDKRNLGAGDLKTPIEGEGVIKIVPVVTGAGKGFGVFQTILGIVIVVVSAYFWNPAGMAFGASLIFGGVAQMLVKPPSLDSLERPENRPSYSFNGPLNTTQQGNPVTLVYGRVITGSQVVHTGVSTDEIPVDADVAVTDPSTGSVGI